MDPLEHGDGEITRARLQALMERRDGPALARLAIQLVSLITALLVTTWLASDDDPRWIVAVIVAAIALVGFFPALHESGHRHAFRRDWLNQLGAWLGAALMLQAPSFFREFHWQHHRATQDPTRDPEISGAAALLDDWPRGLLHYLLLASGQLLMVGKALLTFACAITPRGQWDRFAPYIRPERRARVAWESRLVAALIVVVGGVGPRVIPGLGHALLAWPFMHVLLGVFLMPEHTGLAHDGSQLRRTRTIYTSALVRFWMWNMPYHAEHHAHPAIPFHALPALHRELAPALCNVSRGYLGFHREALRRALRGR